MTLAMFNEHSVQTFLHYGYISDQENPTRFFKEWEPVPKAPGIKKTLSQYVSEGTAILDAVFVSLLKEIPASTLHVVPLSGGLDSRAILGGLLKYLEPPQIQTITFGLPGTWDFEIGQQIANVCGVPNTVIDFSTISWADEDVIDFAGKCQRPFPLFEGFLFHHIRTHAPADAIFWSGFIGETVSGSHMPDAVSHSWSEALTNFAQRQRYARFIRLTPTQFDPTSELPQVAFLPSHQLSYDEQLDFAIRQQNYIEPLVLLPGYQYRTPFVEKPWLNFMLNIPAAHRNQQRAYREIIQTAYPGPFSMPTKTNWGLPLKAPAWQRHSKWFLWRASSAGRRFLPKLHWPVNPATNYIDFARWLRERPDFQQLVWQNLLDLQQRHLVDWLDITGIWQKHQAYRANYADALTLLASLEIFLKAETLQSEYHLPIRF